jgi:hypothetical protein
MSFRSFAAAMVLCLSLLLSAGALTLSALAFQGDTNTNQPDDALVRVSGIGNSGNAFFVSHARRTARLAKEMCRPRSATSSSNRRSGR